MLSGLFLEDVLEQVLVPLDEPVGVDLSLLDLLLTISLNTSKQVLQLVLLFMSENGFLLGKLDMQLFLHVLDLLLLESLADELDLLCVDIVFN